MTPRQRPSGAIPWGYVAVAAILILLIVHQLTRPNPLAGEHCPPPDPPRGHPPCP
jgi:hypothetical protein